MKSVCCCCCFVVAVVCFVTTITTVSANSVWPMPQSFSAGTTTLGIDPSSFSITTSSTSGVLQRAITRYQELFFLFPVSGAAPGNLLTKLQITVTNDDGEETIQWTTNESYQLSVSAPTATITAKTIYGAIHGLETFSQLISYDLANMYYTIPGTPITIDDYPRFSWRGILVDTARHFIDITTLKKIIDGMSYNKMNVFHWHIVDAETFPVVTSAYPLLSSAAYAPWLVYSQEQIADVVKYANDRGVRVVPEFDMPGHGYSWGIGYPNLTVSCPSYEHNINNIPLDPTQDFTYSVIEELFYEMSQLFVDHYIHTGGDELVEGCWNENAAVKKYMTDRGWSTTDLEQYFCDKVETIVAGLKKLLVIWQDEMDDGLTINPGTVIQAWKSSTAMRTAATRGLYSLCSYGWYLAKQTPVSGSSRSLWLDTWMDLYLVEPLTGLTDLSTEQQALVLGGEACMWGEQADVTNMEGMIWPRTSAVAERLWSASTVKDTTAAKPRLIEFRCRSAQRGILGGPLAPDFCLSVPPSP